MGCDIHCYVEHRKPEGSWSSFGHDLNPGRDYPMFAVLAGVRDYGEEPIAPVVGPRGFPADAGWRATEANTLWVSDTDPEGEGNCSRERAEQWVASGTSQWARTDQKRVTHPDWHSHSWLSLREWGQAIEARSALPSAWKGPDAEYYAISGMLGAFEALGEEARVVFWFDN